MREQTRLQSQDINYNEDWSFIDTYLPKHTFCLCRRTHRSTFDGLDSAINNLSFQCSISVVVLNVTCCSARVYMQIGLLKNSCPLCFLFCLVLLCDLKFKTKIGKTNVAAVYNNGRWITTCVERELFIWFTVLSWTSTCMCGSSLLRVGCVFWMSTSSLQN